MYNESFLSNLSEDVYIAAKHIVEVFYENVELARADEDVFEYHLEFYYCLQAYLAARGIKNLPTVDFKENKSQVRKAINNIAKLYYGAGEKREIDLKKNMLQNKYSVMINKSFGYKFSDNDFSRMQELINEVRDLVSESKLIDQEHKSRLLSRLEKLQSEIHKVDSNLDKFWGLMGDAGVMLGKFGSDVKPIVDRIREVLEIVCRTQAQSEQLPGKLPLALPERDSAKTN